MIKVKLWTGSLLLFVLAPSTHAKRYNYFDLPMGSRAFGMGNTSMALSGDVALMLSNPANLALQEESQISASLSSYTKTDTRTGEYVSAFASAKDNVSERSFRAIPVMVGGSLNTRRWHWGGGIFVPRFFLIQGTLNNDKGNSGSFSGKDESVWIGAFGAKSLGKRWLLGVSTFYSSQSIQEKFLYLTDNPSSFRFTERHLQTNALFALIGASYKMSPRWRLGLSLLSPGWVLGGSGALIESTDTAANLQNAKFKAKKSSVPARFSTGIAWQANDKFVAAFDLHLHAPKGGNLTDSNLRDFEIRSKLLVNASMGLEWSFWEYLSLRWGAYTNLSSAKWAPSYLTAVDDRVNMVGSSGAIVITRKTGTVSLGGYLVGGQGKGSDLQGGSSQSVPRSSYLYGFNVGSTFKFE